MAGTVTKEETTYTSVKKIIFTWVSAANGTATATTSNSFTATQPTNAYDVAVNDSDGIDVLHGLGADLSNAASTVKDYTDGVGAVVNSKLSLSVTNAGDSKGGKTIIYLR